MNAYHLHYLSLFRGCIILRCVRFFLIFSLNCQQRARRRCIRIRNWEEITKSSFKGKLKANLWIHLDLAKVHRLKELTTPYIASYLHFLNSNDILTLPKFLPSLKLRFIWRNLYLPCFLPARFTCMRASLPNQNKCKRSILHSSFLISMFWELHLNICSKIINSFSTNVPLM